MKHELGEIQKQYTADMQALYGEHLQEGIRHDL